jgi:hypothetical protein
MDAPTDMSKHPKPLRERIAIILGNESMTAGQVMERLTELDQLPVSADVRGYIGYVMSATKVDKYGRPTDVNYFERDPTMGRGYYKNRPGWFRTPEAPPATAWDKVLTGLDLD